MAYDITANFELQQMSSLYLQLYNESTKQVRSRILQQAQVDYMDEPENISGSPPPPLQASSSTTSFFVGLSLTVIGAFFNGLSRTVTRMAMTRGNDLAMTRPSSYLRNPVWWCGLLSMAAGESCNFIALALSPAALVGPVIGALTVLFGLLLATVLLNEYLSVTATLGCALSIIGVILVITNVPQSGGVRDIDTLMGILSSPVAFLYLLTSSIVIVVLLRTRRSSYHILQLATAGGFASSLLVSSSKTLTISLSSPSPPLLLILLSILILITCVLIGIHVLTTLLAYFPTSRVVVVTFPIYVIGQVSGGALIFHEWANNTLTDIVNVGCGFLTSAIAVTMMCLDPVVPRTPNVVIR